MTGITTTSSTVATDAVDLPQFKFKFSVTALGLACLLTLFHFYTLNCLGLVYLFVTILIPFYFCYCLEFLELFPRLIPSNLMLLLLLIWNKWVCRL